MSATKHNPATLTQTKVAWVRDPDIPAGRPALGSFRCICGATITGVEFGSPFDYICAACGRAYDGRGWLVTQP